jgi:hypothetical protein
VTADRILEILGVLESGGVRAILDGAWGVGRSVFCISAPVQVLCHLGYEPTSQDAQDVLDLCRSFALQVPKEYARFLGTV